MRKLSYILVLAMVLTGTMLGPMSAPSGAQSVVTTYTYPPPPPNPYAHPWVGPNTPWVYYNGDWFLNGDLYYYYGPSRGWAPYFAYDTVYVERPASFYDPRWNVWYEQHPDYWVTLRREYPYWVEHRQGQIYEEKFYIEHHKGENRWRRAWKELRRED